MKWINAAKGFLSCIARAYLKRGENFLNWHACGLSRCVMDVEVGQICSVLSEVKSSVCEMVIFVAIASYRRWSHIRHRNEWVMATIECRSSPEFEPISPTVYIRVSSLFDIRTTSYWVQHTPKCHFCRSCRDTTEDDKHFTVISRWRVIKTIKIFPCRNILTSVIDVSWKLRGKIFTVKRKHFTTWISKLFPVDPKIQFLEFLPWY